VLCGVRRGSRSRGTKVSWIATVEAPTLAPSKVTAAFWAVAGSWEGPLSDTKTSADEDVALVRYLVVAQVCAEIAAGASKTAAVHEVAGRAHMGLRQRVRRFGERTLWRWLSDWAESGLEGRAQPPRSPPTSSLPTAFLELLEHLKKTWPETSVPEVIRIARARGVVAEDDLLDRTTVWRHCRRQGLTTRRRNAAKQDRQRPWRFEHRMQCVLADGKHFRAGATRAKRVAIIFLDNATRFVLGASVGTSESAALALSGLRKVIRRWGLMSCLYVDLGFDNDDMARACAALKIAFILGTKKYPEGRGALERLNRTANEQLLCGWPGNPAIAPEPDALERRIEHWASEQYNHTPHEALALDSPANRFHGDSRPLVMPASQAMLDEAFVTSFPRRVTNHNCVSVDGVLWELPLGHRRERLEVFRNMISGQLLVLHNGVRTALKPVDLVSNAYDKSPSQPPAEPVDSAPRPTAADSAWARDHPPLTDDDGNYRGAE